MRRLVSGIAQTGRRANETSVRSVATSRLSIRLERLRRHEALQPAGMRMQPGPAIYREIDDDQAGGRELFRQPLAGLDVAGRDQQAREVVQTRIVPDPQERGRRGWRIFE